MYDFKLNSKINYYIKINCWQNDNEVKIVLKMQVKQLYNFHFDKKYI